MAVITRYVVVRDGVELDRVFEVKREAEAYDKMLDAADNLSKFIKDSDLEIDLDEKTIEEISIFLSKNGPEVVRILRGIKPAPVPSKNADSDKPDKKAEEKTEQPASAPVKEKKKAKSDKSKRKKK